MAAMKASNLNPNPACISMSAINVTSLERMRKRAQTQTWAFFVIGIAFEGGTVAFVCFKDFSPNTTACITCTIVFVSIGLALIGFSLTGMNERVAKLDAACISAENGWGEHTQAYVKAACTMKISFKPDPVVMQFLELALRKPQNEDHA
jgi:hypothetical protein